MGKLKSIMPMFIVSDLSAAVSYYTDVLGFDLRLQFPEEGDSFFAIIGCGEVGIMLKHINDNVGPLPNPVRHEWAKWDAFIECENPSEFADSCKLKSGVEFTVAETEDGLYGFEATDNDGYVLFFGHLK